MAQVSLEIYSATTHFVQGSTRNMLIIHNNGQRER